MRTSRSQDNAKNNKFFLKRKASIFLINNKEKLRKQIFVSLFFSRSMSTNNAKTTISTRSNSIEIEAIKIFKIIDTLIDKLYNKSWEINAKFKAIVVSTLTTQNNNITKIYKDVVLNNIAKFV